MNNTQTVSELVKEIGERLNNIEDVMAWTIMANQRFKKGQRVKFSKIADRKCIGRRTKKGVRCGKILKVDGFWIEVLLDGYKKSSKYHHSFFEYA